MRTTSYRKIDRKFDLYDVAKAVDKVSLQEIVRLCELTIRNSRYGLGACSCEWITRKVVDEWLSDRKDTKHGSVADPAHSHEHTNAKEVNSLV